MPPTSTDRPPDPLRFERVEELVRAGHPDRVVLRMVAEEFSCHVNTARADLHRFWDEMALVEPEKKLHRRNVTRYKLESLSAEVLEEARITPDPKARAINYKTVESLYGRLVQLDGIAESDRLKADILRQKLLESFSEDELQRAIAVEAEAHLRAMPDAELEALIERRKGS